MADKKISVVEVINDWLYQNGISKSHLARKLNESSSNMVQKFAKGDLDTGYVLRICEALDHDFFADLSKAYRREVKKEPQDLSDAMAMMKELLKQNSILLAENQAAKQYPTAPVSNAQLNEPSSTLKPKKK